MDMKKIQVSNRKNGATVWTVLNNSAVCADIEKDYRFFDGKEYDVIFHGKLVGSGYTKKSEAIARAKKILRDYIKKMEG